MAKKGDNKLLILGVGAIAAWWFLGRREAEAVGPPPEEEPVDEEPVDEEPVDVVPPPDGIIGAEILGLTISGGV